MADGCGSSPCVPTLSGSSRTEPWLVAFPRARLPAVADGACGRYPDAIFGWAVVPSGGDSCDVLLRDAPVLDVRPLLVEKRARLVDRLRSFGPSQWAAATALPGWTVNDVALHLLDDDLGRLSRDRDGEATDHLRARTASAVARLPSEMLSCERCDRGVRLPVTRAKVARRCGVAVVLDVPMEECPTRGE
jgi:hypothetical protein